MYTPTIFKMSIKKSVPLTLVDLSRLLVHPAPGAIYLCTHNTETPKKKPYPNPLYNQNWMTE